MSRAPWVLQSPTAIASARTGLTLLVLSLTLGRLPALLATKALPEATETSEVAASWRHVLLVREDAKVS
jgi:hypothetical protein